jgi:hypothetical protein
LVDIDPTTIAPKYAPRETNLVDAVAAAKRIADQIMRSNPLKDATIDGGLTRWTGNYGGSLVWIGEILPADQNQFDQYGHVKPQRGFVLQRDDPGQNFAITMYDFDPHAGVALNQRLQFFDVNGRRTWADAYNGGRAFPDAPVVLYQREVLDPSGFGGTSDTILYSGEGNCIGTRLSMAGAWAAPGGTPTYSMFLRVSGGGVTINTATTSGSGAGNIVWDVDIKTIFDASTYINVEWHMWKTGGTGALLPRPYYCRMYGNLTAP